MARVGKPRWLTVVALGTVLGTMLPGRAQEMAPVPQTVPQAALNVASLEASDKPLPINLPTALQLAGVQPLDIAIASQRIQAAAAQLKEAKVLWLPTFYLGGDYFRHDGE